MRSHIRPAAPKPRDFGYRRASFALRAISLIPDNSPPKLKARFLRVAGRNALAPHRTKAGSHDNMLGGVILDAFFNAAFPGLSLLFYGLGATDVVDLYDSARDAFNPMAGRKLRVGNRPANDPALAFLPLRPKRSVLALVFG